MANVLLVDDMPDVLEGLKLAFGRTDHTLLSAASGEQAIAILNSEPVDVVVTDLKMEPVDGMAVLRHARSLSPPPSVILLTAHGTIETAVDALREGAYHFLTKPVNVKELRAQVEKAAEHNGVLRENRELRAQLDRKFSVEGMVGDSPEMRAVFDQVRMIAPTRATVLIEGESGTGKEVLARAIHRMSPRANRPFVAVHCAALPETLLESELFGHERGAFTGAVARKPGRFEMADGGTILLDEVGEIPLSMQVKLLRVLEARELQRVGGTQTLKVDVRVIAATNRELSEEVAEGRFREDLYYRLNVVHVRLPALRTRRSDIAMLARHFLAEFARDHGRPAAPELTREALDALQAYHWPGNIRELRNVMENTIVFLRGDKITPADLPASIKGGTPVATQGITFPLGLPLEEVETQYIKTTLKQVDGNRTKAAEVLGISRRTLQRRIKELGLEEA
jgi:two-component system response regulator HydG